MKLDTIPNDSATTISRNRVSFNMCQSEDKDRSSVAKFAKKISNASNKVNLILTKFIDVQKNT